jgi:hypothetical protein
MPQHWLRVQDFARERVPSSEAAAAATPGGVTDFAGSVGASETAGPPAQHDDNNVPAVARFLNFGRESRYEYVLLNGLGRYCIHRSSSAEPNSILCMLFIEAGYHKRKLQAEVYPSFEQMRLEFSPNTEAPTLIIFHGHQFSLPAQLPANLDRMKEIIVAKVIFLEFSRVFFHSYRFHNSEAVCRAEPGEFNFFSSHCERQCLGSGSAFNRLLQCGSGFGSRSGEISALHLLSLAKNFIRLHQGSGYTFV